MRTPLPNADLWKYGINPDYPDRFDGQGKLVHKFPLNQLSDDIYASHMRNDVTSYFWDVRLNLDPVCYWIRHNQKSEREIMSEKKAHSLTIFDTVIHEDALIRHLRGWSWNAANRMKTPLKRDLREYDIILQGTAIKNSIENK